MLCCRWHFVLLSFCQLPVTWHCGTNNRWRHFMLQSSATPELLNWFRIQIFSSPFQNHIYLRANNVQEQFSNNKTNARVNKPRKNNTFMFHPTKQMNISLRFRRCTDFNAMTEKSVHSPSIFGLYKWKEFVNRLRTWAHSRLNWTAQSVRITNVYSSASKSRNLWVFSRLLCRLCYLCDFAYNSSLQI